MKQVTYTFLLLLSISWLLSCSSTANDSANLTNLNIPAYFPSAANENNHLTAESQGLGHACHGPKRFVPRCFTAGFDKKKFLFIESMASFPWWQQFNSATLNQLIESGVKQNNDVNIALANLEQARGYLKQVDLSWVPGVGVYGGYSSNPAWGYPGNFLGIYPSFTLNIFQLLSEHKQAKYKLELSKAAVSGVRLTVIGQISASYFTYLAESYQLQLLKQLDQDKQNLITINESALKIGLTQQMSLDQLISDERLVKANMAVVTQNIKVSANALHYLVNENPGTINADESFSAIDGSKYKIGALPVTVLKNRPDFIEAGLAMQAAHEGINIAYSNFWPNMQLDDFVGGVSGNSNFTVPNQYSNLTDEYINWGINLNVLGQIEEQEGAYKATTFKYIKTVRRILRDVDNDFSANKLYTKRLLAVENAYARQLNSYNLHLALYRQGIIAYTVVLQNKILLDNLALTLNQTKLQQLMTVVMLYQDLAIGVATLAVKN